jgi:hypothetical protein
MPPILESSSTTCDFGKDIWTFLCTTTLLVGLVVIAHALYDFTLFFFGATIRSFVQEQAKKIQAEESDKRTKEGRDSFWFNERLKATITEKRVEKEN